MPHLITDDDCEIYYETHGKGPAIAFISGFMGITDIWHAQIAEFSSRYQCIAFDTRGAGRSEKPLPRVAYGVSRHARDLACVLDSLGVSRVALVGHSMGGNTALEAYAANPGRVAALILIGSYVSGQQIIDAGNRPELIRAAVSRLSSRTEFYTSVGLPPEISIESTKWPLYAVLGNAESFLAFDGSALLPKVRVPTLVVHGTRDVVSPLDPCATGLVEGIADAELAVLADVNHCPMVEAPNATNARMAEFLKRCFEQ